MLISNDLPTYPGDPSANISPKIKFSEKGYNVLSICMGTHSGTHLDVPLHLLDGGASVDRIALEKFAGEAIFAEILKNKNEKITLKEIKNLDLKSGDILIVRTGWEENKYGKNYFRDFPYFSIEAADYIISKKIKSIGADIPAVDGPEQNGAFHRKMMNAGIIIIEALVNLKQVVGKRIFFTALPLNIKDADGSPVRAAAFEF
ncbi:MAG: cyclase family protein [Actinobacteria bacterium]|nr:cyclase family protein [Actinomycetota bacterium]